MQSMELVWSKRFGSWWMPRWMTTSAVYTGYEDLSAQDRDPGERAQVPGAPGQGGCPAGQHGPRQNHQYTYGICGSSHSKDDAHQPSWREKQGRRTKLIRTELFPFYLGKISFKYVIQNFTQGVGHIVTLDKAAIKTAKSFALNCKYFVQTPTCVKIKS